MKIAIIGANGQLGYDITRTFEDTEHKIFSLTHNDIEITDFNLSEKVLKNINPDVVINCAAYVKVDDAEDFADKAFYVNATGSRNIALVCKNINAILMHISTDYVFDGRKKQPYTEDDVPNPLNVYGNSKLAGEYFVRNILEKYYIVRSSSLFGVAGSSGKGGNFVEAVIKKAHNKEKIEVVDDMIMSPTYTKDAAWVIRSILIKKLPFGLYHIANEGQCSWYRFAETIFEILNMNVKLFKIKNGILQAKARRPLFSALATVKLKKHGLEMDDWEKALMKYLAENGHIKK